MFEYKPRDLKKFIDLLPESALDSKILLVYGDDYNEPQQFEITKIIAGCSEMLIVLDKSEVSLEICKSEHLKKNEEG